MRKLSLVIVLAAASFSVTAQQQPQKPAAENPQSTAPQSDPTIVERVRTEGAAGGTAPVPDEKRKAVGAGAGPHRHDNLPSPAKLPRDKPIEPSK